MDANFSSAEAEHSSGFSQHSQQSHISLSTEEEHEDEEREDEEHEHATKRRKTSKVWDHFTHPANIKGVFRSTCNHCRYAVF